MAGRGGGGRRVAGKATQVHAGMRAGSVCQTAGKLGEEGVGGWFWCVGGHGGQREGCCCAVRLVGLFCFAESNTIWQR